MSDPSSFKNKIKSLRSRTVSSQSKTSSNSLSLPILHDGDDYYYEIDHRSLVPTTSLPSPSASNRTSPTFFPPPERLSLSSQSVSSQTTRRLQPVPSIRNLTISAPTPCPKKDSTSTSFKPARTVHLLYLCYETKEFVGNHMIRRGALNLDERCKVCGDLLYPPERTGLALLAIKMMKHEDEKEKAEKARVEKEQAESLKIEVEKAAKEMFEKEEREQREEQERLEQEAKLERRRKERERKERRPGIEKQLEEIYQWGQSEEGKYALKMAEQREQEEEEMLKMNDRDERKERAKRDMEQWRRDEEALKMNGMGSDFF